MKQQRVATGVEELKVAKSSETYRGNKAVVSMFELRMSLQSLMVALALVLIFVGPGLGMAAPLGEPDDEAFDMENYDLNSETDWENLDINIYGDSYDYDDLDQEIEVGTVAPDTPPPEHHEEEVTLPSQPTLPPAPVTLDFKGPGLFGPETGLGMPTCLLCVCIGGSVYCDDAGLDQIPPLPKDTTHFYGRFNKIRHLKNTDFINLNKLQSIDLTGNQISEMDEDAFRSLLHLQQLLLADNNLQMIPELPITMKRIDLRNNRLISQGMHTEVFKDMSQLEFLYLSNNNLDYIPTPLPLSLRVLHLQNNNIQSLHEDTFCNHHDRKFIRHNLEDIRLDGNPLNINLFAQAYICLPRLPVGSH
ncbi:opticin isoform X1 [Thunnus albacares]|uniref:opticin isoform X1 n=1 Tax=Thunnus maccoyii TaxID=8240 RepID=UPI001C4C90A1|nr:opticin isoform X1 [Thunnus maccoyii]XP_044205410.1 opticin isoform X1 [Thunnus albacares]